jgi:hypothetical protein
MVLWEFDHQDYSKKRISPSNIFKNDDFTMKNAVLLGLNDQTCGFLRSQTW